MKSRQLSQVDCNVICSTNANLQTKCEAQEFTLAENVAAYTPTAKLRRSGKQLLPQLTFDRDCTKSELLHPAIADYH